MHIFDIALGIRAWYFAKGGSAYAFDRANKSVADLFNRSISLDGGILALRTGAESGRRLWTMSSALASSAYITYKGIAYASCIWRVVSGDASISHGELLEIFLGSR